MKTNYIEIRFGKKNIEPYLFDLLADTLSKIGCESFSDDEKNFSAFIAENNFSENKLKNTLKDFVFADFSDFQIQIIENKNWNEEWEKNYFQPIISGDKYVIHSSFHQNIPHAKYDITINPKMAFGTGHHATTRLMLDFILETQIADKQVLDMGCGTAVLAILAMMRQAKSCLAVDIDTWCVENAKENILINNIENVEVLQGDSNVLKNRHFDIILANINRNILLADMQIYVQCLNANGLLFLSGFYAEDVPLLTTAAENVNLQLAETKQNANWCALKFVKKHSK
ncbi:MAG: 50S ribosomal protein L11 methyltransferase [Paludibacter sp.]|nr:50S ribosomal protein L11 methyltransferase [Paludibacter sp.]